MGTPLPCGNIIRVRENGFHIAIVPLHRYFKLNGSIVPFTGPFEINRIGEKRYFVFIQVGYKRDKSPIKTELRKRALFIPFVPKTDIDPFIEECQLPQPTRQNIGIIFEDCENFLIRPESNLSAPLLSLSNHFQRQHCFASTKFHLIDFMVFKDLHHEFLRQSIDTRNPYAMQTPRHLISLFAELSTRMQYS